MEYFSGSLIANYIAIGVLILKSGFDLFFNRYLFDKEIENGSDSLDALERRNKRGNLTSTIAFAAMSISIILAIGGSMADANENATKKDIENLQELIAQHNKRLKKIEDFLWPPSEPGDYGSRTPNGPWDPVDIQSSIAQIKEELADLMATGNIREDRLNRLIKIVNQLTENVEQFERSTKQLEKFMAAPAG